MQANPLCSVHVPQPDPSHKKKRAQIQNLLWALAGTLKRGPEGTIVFYDLFLIFLSINGRVKYTLSLFYELGIYCMCFLRMYDC